MNIIRDADNGNNVIVNLIALPCAWSLDLYWYRILWRAQTNIVSVITFDLFRITLNIVG